MTSSFVGRSSVLDELDRACAAARASRGAVVVLEGEAGIGKTSVARRIAETADAHGLVVSWGTCSSDRSAPPLHPWLSLLGDVRVEPAHDDSAGAARFELLQRLARHVVNTPPRLHVIEDVQWADVASVLLLKHVVSEITRAPLLVIATLRTGEPLVDAIETVRHDARVIDLVPFDDKNVAALVKAAGGAPDIVAPVMARTGGNPLFVTELLRGIAMRGAVDDLPRRVTEIVQHRLGRLPDPVVDLVRAAAVLGSDGDVRVLASLQALDVELALELVEQARATHLLVLTGDRWQFRHEIVRDAVYESLTAVARAQLHARALDVLTAVSPSVLATHALAAQPLLDPERAVALAARAGEHAFAQMAYEEAIGWIERALEVSAAAVPRWRADLLLLVGDAHRHLGHTAAAQRAFHEASQLVDDPALLARAALGYASPGADLGIAFRSEDPETARLLERALDCQPETDSVTSVQLQARLAAELYFSAMPERSRELASAACEAATRSGDPRALVAAFSVFHDAFVVGQADLATIERGSLDLLAWARRTESVAASLTAHRARIMDLLAAGEFAAMDAEIVAFTSIAEQLRIPAYQWWVALWSAMRALLDGRHDDAETLAQRAYEVGAQPFGPLAMANFSFMLFFLRREQGRLAELEALTRDMALRRADIPAIRVALMFLLAETGKLEEATALLADVDERALVRLRDRNWPATWFQLARVALVVNDGERAAKLLELAPSERYINVSLASACLGASQLAIAWLHHAMGDVDAADRAYAEAETMNARIGARSWLQQARDDRARLTERLSTRSGASFVNEGAVWHVHYAGHSARMSDTKGLADIATLLARPGVPVHAVELLTADGTPSPAGVKGALALDDRARRDIRDRLRELEAEIDDAEHAHDGARASRAREARQQLAERVAKDLGLGGRSRRVDDPVERARKTVSTRIRRAIAQVTKAHPELGRHLDRSIDTGTWCAYQPADEVHWQT